MNNYWLRRWETKDILFHNTEINTDLITYFSKLHIKKNQCILVPLCGKSMDMLWLAKQGYQVIGIELSPIACEEFFAENHIQVTKTIKPHFIKYTSDNIEIFCGDIFLLKSIDLPKVHGIYDCKALIALPHEYREPYLKCLITAVGKDVSILLFAIETKCKVEGPPFPIDSTEIHSLFGRHFQIQQLKKEQKTDISEHLMAKGYTDLTDTIYLLKPLISN